MLSRFLRSHDQVSVWANWNLSGLCTEKAESVIRVTYRQRSFYQGHVLINAVYQGSVRADQNLSGSYTEKQNPLSGSCAGRTGSVPWRQVVERFIVERFIMERFVVERFIMER